MAESDDENFPPTEFILSTIYSLRGNTCYRKNYQIFEENEDDVENDDENHRQNGAKEGNSNVRDNKAYCPSCWRSFNRAICSNCVNNQEEFRSKKFKLIFLRQERQRLLNSYCERWTARETMACERTSNILNDKNQVEPRIRRLSNLLRYKRDLISKKRDRLASLKSERLGKTELLAKLRSSTEFFRHRLSQLVGRTSPIASLDRRQRQLALTRQLLVADLLKYIFPLETVSSTSQRVDEAADDVSDMLSDATTMMFTNDRWVLMQKSAEAQYSVVQGCLAPDNSNYGLMKNWLFYESVPGCKFPCAAVSMSAEKVPTSQAALGILAALAYCAQLTDAIARLLDVRLPFALSISDFFGEKLQENELETAIVKLNANVALLCCSQRVSGVVFDRPFWNLTNLMTGMKAVGFNSPIAVAPRLLLAYRQSERSIAWQERAVVTVAEAAEDWENVSEPLPEWTGAASSPPRLSQLWSSAATSVANLFKMHN